MSNAPCQLLFLSRLRDLKTAEAPEAPKGHNSHTIALGFNGYAMPCSLSTPVDAYKGGFCFVPDTAMAQGDSVSSSRGSPPLLISR